LDGISEQIAGSDIAASAVLSGNRNFEGRIHPDIKQNYLASPPLVVAFALAGTVDIDLTTEPLGIDRDGKPVMLSDLWPSDAEVAAAINASLTPEMFIDRYSSAFSGDEHWQSIDIAQGETFAWIPDSTYVRRPTFLENVPAEPSDVHDIIGARVLAKLGNSVTTDHISPAGSIKASVPAGVYLTGHGVANQDFNSYGTRRGNHEVMVRGTFANVRLRNQLAPGTEGGITRHLPEGTEMSIFEASLEYEKENTPLVIIAGSEYGTGSSRDWAAKGTKLLGARAVIVESFERIHRSNLVGMGVLPLQFLPGQNADGLGLDGTEVITISGLEVLNTGKTPKTVTISAQREDGSVIEFEARVRIDTPTEADYYRHGGVIPFVLRQLAKS
jgi:aconitate hydratase